MERHLFLAYQLNTPFFIFKAYQQKTNFKGPFCYALTHLKFHEIFYHSIVLCMLQQFCFDE